MKIKTISRSSDTYVPVRNTQESALPRNLNPALHPHERAREYTKALTATKLERMFAQPFVGQLGDGHRDGVYCMARDLARTDRIATGSGDGIVKVWNLTSRDEMSTFKAHSGMVSGLAITPNSVLSCGDDKKIQMWSVGKETPEKTFLGEHAFKGLDNHIEEGIFCTGGARIHLWDVNRSRYTSDMSWGADNVHTVRFNRTERNIIASAGSDNSLVLYDIRTNSPIQKVVTTMRTNAISWNPMEAYNFASACEDHNAYLWDMRNLTKSVNIYKDHVAAVMDVDFSPTGQELVTGSYDKTLRIFRPREGHSRDIYHTKRMQRIFCVRFSSDARYILSSSDDTNVRIWRANASDRAGVKSNRQRNKLNYDNALKERFKHMPEIRRISRHRHLPSTIKKAKEIKRDELASLKRREENRQRYGEGDQKSEKERHIRGTAIKDD